MRESLIRYCGGTSSSSLAASPDKIVAEQLLANNLKVFFEKTFPLICFFLPIKSELFEIMPFIKVDGGAQIGRAKRVSGV